MASGAENLLVAAIDFGTTYSGYAFSFLYQYQRDPLKISCNHWPAGSGSLISLKTPTCILFKPCGTFHSFGFEAEDKYFDLALDDEQEGWYFFRRFKMKLYESKYLNRMFELEDDQGKRMPAIKVFSSAIQYLKDHMIQACKKQVNQMEESDILWVLTVPAIWSDSSKQFMREAAQEAGIVGNRLMIALEPEAASLYCRYYLLEKHDELKTFNTGSKYLVLDAGGGTIDITVHQVQQDGTLKEVHKANGGDWGGTKVDNAFQHLLSGMIGYRAFHTFLEHNKADMIELFRDFEVKKRTIRPDAGGEEKVTFKVPTTMNESCKKENGQDIASVVRSNQSFAGILTVRGDKLRVSGLCAKQLFTYPAGNIVDHIGKVLQNPSTCCVKSILMVGGFSESLVLQDVIRRNFPFLQVIVPQDAGLAVLKGAVIFGHEPRTIKTRVCKYTYGVATTQPFDPNEHDPSKRFITSFGEHRCRDIFDIHVQEGDSVNIGEPQAVQVYDVIEPDQTRMTFLVFISTQRNPTYITDPGCTEIGSLTVDMSDISRGLDRQVDIRLTFSNTELEVEASDPYTCQKVKAAFDCLK